MLSYFFCVGCWFAGLEYRDWHLAINKGKSWEQVNWKIFFELLLPVQRQSITWGSDGESNMWVTCHIIYTFLNSRVRFLTYNTLYVLVAEMFQFRFVNTDQISVPSSWANSAPSDFNPRAAKDTKLKLPHFNSVRQPAVCPLRTRNKLVISCVQYMWLISHFIIYTVVTSSCQNSWEYQST